MDLLKKRILCDGKVISDNVLKVDSFLNHQLDPILIREMGSEISRRFSSDHVTKVLTVESSGIALAVMTGYFMQVPVIFAKNKFLPQYQIMYCAPIVFPSLRVKPTR